MLEIKKKIAKLYKIFVIIIITYLWQKYNELELVCNQWDSTHQQSSDFSTKMICHKSKYGSCYKKQ